LSRCAARTRSRGVIGITRRGFSSAACEPDDQARAAVYYTALLVNVGCHTDAHEQAKWFGDDIALKADKYGPHDLRSKRSMVSGLRRIGSGNPSLQRFRIGLGFVLSGATARWTR
jgi:hypothetical protein